MTACCWTAVNVTSLLLLLMTSARCASFSGAVAYLHNSCICANFTPDHHDTTSSVHLANGMNDLALGVLLQLASIQVNAGKCQPITVSYDTVRPPA